MSDREREMFDLIRSAGHEERGIAGGSILVEGAVDRFCGRPLGANPYAREDAAAAWRLWRDGWREAHHLLEQRGQEEARRWLEEGA